MKNTNYMLITSAPKLENLLACKSLLFIQNAVEDAWRLENKSPENA